MSDTSKDAKVCPWCKRWCLKDNACDYVFACGLDDKNVFNKNQGCGRTWCWRCEKKYCSKYYDPETGVRLPTAKDNHDATCCSKEAGYVKEEYCPGGHSSHCAPR